MKKKWIQVLAAGSILLLGFQSALLAASANSRFETKTKVRIEKSGIWLESEISPNVLMTALPLIDVNNDARLDETELSNGRENILSYYSGKIKLESDGSRLAVDSTYFAFRSPATTVSLPDRFFIYHWYATLRQPEEIKIWCDLFNELKESHRHKGSLVSGKYMIKFHFPNNMIAPENRAIEIKLSDNGKPALVKADDDITRAGYVWIGVGLSGLLILRIAAAARTRRRRILKPKFKPEESPALG